MDRYKVIQTSELTLQKRINEHAEEYDLAKVVPVIILGTVQYYTVIMERKGWYSRER